MKAPEFYIGELALLLHCLKFSFEDLSMVIQKDLHRSKRKAFWMPWAKHHILMAASIRAQAGMQALKDIKDLQDKLLESTGTDADMQPVTLKEILKIKDD